MNNKIVFGEKSLTIEDIVHIATHAFAVELTGSKQHREKLDAGVALLNHFAKNSRVYGVNTGVGDSCETSLNDDELYAFPENLFRFHGCGTGTLFSETESSAILAVRIASLCRGYSAVRTIVIERLIDLINHRILPCIPCEGSVGASGDLTPLSYIAAVISGEREAFYEGNILPSIQALAHAGLTPLRLEPKESLAIMNGTSVMTGLACLASNRARHIARLASTITAMASDVLLGRAEHFHPRIFELKPHAGTIQAAALIREVLGAEKDLRHADDRRLQDRYSLRCAPHVIGVLLDTLTAMEPLINIEINSINDNPIIDPDTNQAFHSGNFYGGHICLAMDTMKNAIANIADLADRQMAMVCNPMMNNGLPANLVRPEAGGHHHGFKAASIATSALAAEALKLTMPASVFSRSTENHNQDKVSMGTIAARDCLRVLELTERTCVITLLAMCQAAELRGLDECTHGTQCMLKAIREHVPTITEDRRMDLEIHMIHDMLQELPFQGT